MKIGQCGWNCNAGRKMEDDRASSTGREVSLSTPFLRNPKSCTRRSLRSSREAYFTSTRSEDKVHSLYSSLDGDLYCLVAPCESLNVSLAD